MYSLSRFQKLKKAYLQLSKRFKLPYDIIKYIFNINYSNDKKIQDELRVFYKNIILFNIMEYKEFPILSINNENSAKTSWRPSIFLSVNELKEDLFKHRFPDKRGIEWGIKAYSSRDSKCIESSNVIAHIDTMLFITIIGRLKYLVTIMEDGRIINAPTKSKVIYLNTTPYSRILSDYDEYLKFSLPIIDMGGISWCIHLKEVKENVIHGQRIHVITERNNNQLILYNNQYN